MNQLLAGIHIAAAAEAMALGTRAGADPRALFEVISNSAGASWMFTNRVPHMLDGDYAPRSAVEIFVKDLGVVLDSGRELRFPLPLAAAATSFSSWPPPPGTAAPMTPRWSRSMKRSPELA